MANVFLVLFFLLYPHTNEPLLEEGKGTTVRKQAPPSGQIKVISYNIRWRSGEDLKAIIKLLKDDPEIGGAAILCLQEVDRRKKRSGHTNTAKRGQRHRHRSQPPKRKPASLS
jgi:hypothetical protein